MTMITNLALILFAVFLVVLALLSYRLFDNDYSSPSFLLICLFLLSTLFAFLGNLKWKAEINLFAILVVFLGIVSILIGEVIARLLVCGKRMIIPRNVRLSNNSKYYFVSKKKFLLLFAAQIIVFYLYYRRMIAIASSIGYSGSGLIQFIRVATVNESIKVGTFFSIFLGLIYAVAYVYLYIFINNFTRRHWFKYVFKHLYLFLPSIILLLTNILSGARSGVIITISVLALFILDRLRRTKKAFKLGKLFVVGIVFVIVFLFIFSKMGELTGKTNSDNFLDVIYVYAGSSILGFGIWMKNPSHSTYFGQESFWGIRYLLNKFLPFIECSEEFLPGVVFPNGSGTNIYTGFKSYYFDFGLIGTIIVCFIIGAFMTFFYLTMSKRNKITITILYGFFFSCFVKLLFAASITSELFTSSQIFGCTWIIVISKFVVTRKNTIKIPLQKQSFSFIPNNGD